MERRERVVMQALAMNGPHPLTDEAVDDAVTRTSPGNYALGYLDDTTFLVFYVGRANADLNERLHDWVGAPSPERYAPDSKAPWASRGGAVMPIGAVAFGPVGACIDSSYTHFAFSYAPSAEAAFAEQCRNHDQFGRAGDLDSRVPSRGGEGFAQLR